MTLTRLRANPEKVRVSIRRLAGMWLAKVAPRTGGNPVVWADERAAAAIDRALEEAERVGMPGVDLGMEWAYEHPWGVAS